MLTAGHKSIMKRKPTHKIYQTQDIRLRASRPKWGGLLSVVVVASKAVSQLMAHDLSPYLPEGYVLGPETIDPFPAKDSL